MKILHLLYESKGDYFGIGGVGIRAYEIYRYLREKHEITLLCKKYPGAEDGYREDLRHRFVGSASSNFTKALLSYSYQAALFVKRHGREFDVILEEFSPAIPTFLHCFSERPIVLQVQGYTGKDYFKKYNIFKANFLYFLEHTRPGLYSNFIFISEAIRNKFPIRKDARTEIIPNGVSPELLHLTPVESNYILYLGRIDMYGKGIDLLISAYEDCCKSFPDMKLVIAGEGREKDMKIFKDLLNRLPKAVLENIELCGWVSGKKKEEVLRNALFVVCPSRHEVQPITTLEAMASGKAVIVSDIPAFSFVVRQQCGISFENGDTLSLARAMKSLISSGERREMGQRGRTWVQDYTWEKIALRFEEFLMSVVNNNSLSW